MCGGCSGRWAWTRQRPARRAAERDEQEIARWIKEEWPRVKKRQAARVVDRRPRRIGVSLTPVVRATWAPKGRNAGAAAQIQLEADEHVRRGSVPGFHHAGTRPHRTARTSRSASTVSGRARSTTAYTLLVGATLYDGASSWPSPGPAAR